MIEWVVLTLSYRQAFLLINAKAATLGQHHRKADQYMSPDLYILCPKYVRIGTNGSDVSAKSRGGGGGGGGGGNELKT